MGYESYVTGVVKIEPAISGQLIAALGLTPDDQLASGQVSANDLQAHQKGEEDTVGVVNGTIAVIPGQSYTEITCRIDERYKAYDLGEHVDRLAQQLKRVGGYKVTGALYVDGEEFDDNGRWRIDANGDAVHELATFLWPNGDKGWG